MNHARMLARNAWDTRDYVCNTRYANQGGVRRSARAREKALTYREAVLAHRVGFDLDRETWVGYGEECAHPYWDECWRCDAGSPNVAALGTVDFDGAYTVG